MPATDDQTGVPAPSDDGHQMSPSVLSSYAALNESSLAEPIETWNRSRSLCIDALDHPGVPEPITRSPWGKTDMDSWIGFATWDPLVHTWDLARAVGQQAIVDSELCQRALERAQDFDAAHNLRRPGVADEARPTTRVDPLGRLLAFAGGTLTGSQTDQARQGWCWGERVRLRNFGWGSPESDSAVESETILELPGLGDPSIVDPVDVDGVEFECRSGRLRPEQRRRRVGPGEREANSDAIVLLDEVVDRELQVGCRGGEHGEEVLNALLSLDADEEIREVMTNECR